MNEGSADTAAPQGSAGSPAFAFPPAAQPSIIRAFQKDAYYQALFRSSLVDTARSVFGARFLAQHAENLSLLAGVAYWTLAAGWGSSQTLGEEYVNAIMVESGSGRIASRKRRLAFVLLLALAPHLLSRAYASLRKYAQRQAAQLAQLRERARLRALALSGGPNSISAASASVARPQQVRSRREALYSFLARRLPALESFHATDGLLAYLGAAHLAIFYLGGRYYALAQRVAGVQYISTIPPHPNSRAPSYEILGLLLAVQLGVKLLLTARARLRESNRREEEEEAAAAAAQASGSQRLQSEKSSRLKKQIEDQSERTMKIDDQLWTHKTAPASLVKSRQKPNGANEDAFVVPLLYPSIESNIVLPGTTKSSSSSAAVPTTSVNPQIRSNTAELAQVADSLLRCTLCMEQRTPERGNSAVTECGHVFCWDCITGWAREKPECPLCRQSITPSRLLPVYNF
ncbi:hypothetical protein A4X09_0g6607 [Tilletia walkeri]|uniref:RING-type E3 ubiquitin transferase n=1 Tax=Tilletia walkeri TaxID=117179 RepID=A0A8X7T219_9BASI|nr:hypothetical protein A4X09_0g6607 [Tilletia walkeri]